MDDTQTKSLRLDTTEDLGDLAVGAAFLGTGGGGDPYIGRLMLQQQLAQGRTPKVVAVEAVHDDWLIVPVATMGAPTVMIEKIPNAVATVTAIRQLERTLGRKVNAVMPAEAGGINATLPLVVGCLTDLPVVDADGMGRAFPELPMITFGIYGCGIAPVVLADDHGATVTMDGVSDRYAETLARAVTVAMGGQAQLIVFPMTGADVKRVAIAATLSTAQRIGRVIRTARGQGLEPVQALLVDLNNHWAARSARLLIQGKVMDLTRTTTGGFARGNVVIEGPTERGHSLRVVFQNEYVVALMDSDPVVMVPDLISILDSATAEPITVESLRFGQRVSVIALSAPAPLRTPAALHVVGPRAFGFDFDFVPHENLVGRTTRVPRDAPGTVNAQPQ